MKKGRVFINFEKEEKWLNKMAKQGWQLVWKGLIYEFCKTTPNDTIIKIDYRCFKTKNEFEEYITLFEDCGWKHIAGTRTSGKQYFKKISNDGNNEIFSDNYSKAIRYKRLSNLWIVWMLIYIPIFINGIRTEGLKIDALLNPKMLYYTPGLWQRTGISFWGGLLFETPFALMRAFAWYILLICIIFYAICAIKANKYYKQIKNESLM